MSTETDTDYIAEALATQAGPGVIDLYRADEATRRIFTREANRVRGFVADELRRVASTAPTSEFAADDDEELAYHEGLREMARRLRTRAEELAP